MAGDLEAITPIAQPLDVLTQTILSMTVRAEWSIDQIFDVIRTSFPYCAIQRDLFDRVIAMLCGCYENTRIRELKPRLSIDNEEGRVTARRGVAQLLYANGGTIPNRGLFHMRKCTHTQADRRARRGVCLGEWAGQSFCDRQSPLGGGTRKPQ